MPERFVINFRDWTHERAAAFPGALKHLEARVKPERLAARGPVSKADWWLFWRPRTSLYEAIGDRRRVLARSRISKHHAFAFIDFHPVFSDEVVVFVLDDSFSFAVLQSFAHEAWTRHYAAVFHMNVRYVSRDCFDTFPFPNADAILSSIGERYHEQRRAHMLGANQGLTRTYNRFHDQRESASAIQGLRDLQVELDEAVSRAYGWDDLPLDHGFHPDPSQTFFGVSEAARSEVLSRLLQLNHRRYAEEVAEGLHGDGGVKRSGKKKRAQP